MDTRNCETALNRSGLTSVPASSRLRERGAKNKKKKEKKRCATRLDIVTSGLDCIIPARLTFTFFLLIHIRPIHAILPDAQCSMLNAQCPLIGEGLSSPVVILPRIEHIPSTAESLVCCQHAAPLPTSHFNNELHGTAACPLIHFFFLFLFSCTTLFKLCCT